MTAPLDAHVDLGTIWITRDGEQIPVEVHEVPGLVAKVLAFADALEDAA